MTLSVDVSVVIAAYNVKAYIKRAIRSALDQEGVNTEVIVVDDASADSTWKVVSSIIDPRLQRLRLAVNGGPGAARNAGIALANAPWIAVLDGDDAFLEGRLKRMLECARRKDADIVMDNLCIHREADDVRFPMFMAEGFSRLKDLDLRSFIAGNQSFFGTYSLGYLKPLFSSAFLRRHDIRYDADVRVGEDYLLFADALACGARCAVDENIGYLYTVRTGSVSYESSSADIRRLRQADARFTARHDLSPEAARAQRWREYNLKEAYAFSHLVDAIKRRDAAEAMKAIRLCPTSLRHLWRPVWVRAQRTFGYS